MAGWLCIGNMKGTARPWQRTGGTCERRIFFVYELHLCIGNWPRLLLAAVGPVFWTWLLRAKWHLRKRRLLHHESTTGRLLLRGISWWQI